MCSYADQHLPRIGDVAFTVLCASRTNAKNRHDNASCPDVIPISLSWSAHGTNFSADKFFVTRYTVHCVDTAAITNGRYAPKPILHQVDMFSSSIIQVIFERFWWDRNGEETPSRAPPAEGDGSGAGGDILSWLVQAVGKALFVKDLSVFPVLYLDDDLCVFEFKAAGTVVVSERIG